MPVNVKLLKKVRKLIAEEPRRMDMHLWGVKHEARFVRSDSNLPPCGTVGCLAGWAVFAARPSLMKKVIPGQSLLVLLSREGTTPAMEAAKLLGIPWRDCPFDRTGWGVPQVLAWIDRQIDAASK